MFVEKMKMHGKVIREEYCIICIMSVYIDIIDYSAHVTFGLGTATHE